jgi:hypothetical protein
VATVAALCLPGMRDLDRLPAEAPVRLPAGTERTQKAA